MSNQGLQIVLGLFRRILRVHRSKLPPPLRPLGDKYVRDEFSLHLNNTETTSSQWRQFVLQWQDYALALEGKADRGGISQQGPVGNVPEPLDQVLMHLSPEQIATLAKVREATSEFGRELTTAELATLLHNAAQQAGENGKGGSAQ